MSSLYSIGLMNEVADAFERDGYTEAQVKAFLSKGRVTAMKAVIEDCAEIKVISDLVHVDRTVRPTYPTWMKEVLHPNLEATGPAEFDCAKLERWLHSKQTAGVVKGQVIYDHLKSNDMLPSCLGLRDLEEIQKKGLSHFRKHFKGQAVFGWKSVVRHVVGGLYAPYLIGRGGEVVLRWDWLEFDWHSTDPALRFAS